MDTKVEYSKKQQQFIRLAENAELKIDYDYSGRGMYGKACPAVYVSDLAEWPVNPYQFQVDQMGKGYVIYAQY